MPYETNQKALVDAAQAAVHAARTLLNSLHPDDIDVFDAVNLRDELRLALRAAEDALGPHRPIAAMHEDDEPSCVYDPELESVEVDVSPRKLRMMSDVDPNYMGEYDTHSEDGL